MKKIGLAIHGGAGTILRSSMSRLLEKEYRKGLEQSLKSGWSILKKGGSSIDAVTEAVVKLENNPLFNAGKGSVFTHEGKNEMDAAIMNGVNLENGGVAGVTGIKNPILLAKCVMEKSEFSLLCGKGAEKFAKKNKLTFEPKEYFFTEKRWSQLQKAIKTGQAFLDHTNFEDIKKKEKYYGTVGAVALDSNGNLAAATSTGGMTNKMFGRIGDSPLNGIGNYADNNSLAISCTGSGEYFIKLTVAYRISALMTYKKMSLKKAADYVINKELIEIGGDGGIIAIDKKANIVLCFNSEGMYRGYVNEKEKFVGIY